MKRITAGIVVGGLVAVAMGTYVAQGFTGESLSKDVDKELKGIGKAHGKACASARSVFGSDCKSHEKAWKSGNVDAFTAFSTCSSDAGSYYIDVLSITREAQEEGGTVVQKALFDALQANVTIGSAGASALKGSIGKFHSSLEKGYSDCDKFGEKTLTKFAGKLNKKDACISLVWRGLPTLQLISPNPVSDSYVQIPAAPQIIWTWSMPDSRFSGDPTSLFCHVVGVPSGSNSVSVFSPFGSSGAGVSVDSLTGVGSCELPMPDGNSEVRFVINDVAVDSCACGGSFEFNDDDDAGF